MLVVPACNKAHPKGLLYWESRTIDPRYVLEQEGEFVYSENGPMKEWTYTRYHLSRTGRRSGPSRLEVRCRRNAIAKTCMSSSLLESHQNGADARREITTSAGLSRHLIGRPSCDSFSYQQYDEAISKHITPHVLNMFRTSPYRSDNYCALTNWNSSQIFQLSIFVSSFAGLKIITLPQFGNRLHIFAISIVPSAAQTGPELPCNLARVGRMSTGSMHKQSQSHWQISYPEALHRP